MPRRGDDLLVVSPELENMIRATQMVRASMPDIDSVKMLTLNMNELFPEVAVASNIVQQWKNAFPQIVSAIFPPLDILKVDTSRFHTASDALRAASTQFLQPFLQIQEQIKSLSPQFEWIKKQETRCVRLEEAGWLPHHSTPWELLEDENRDDHALNEAIERHYGENWGEIRASFEREVFGYSIDDEAKATFAEALDAHEAGLFRCVARTLFPEIERVSRVEIHKGAMDKIAGQAKLKDAISDLYPSDLARDGISGMRLYGKLVHHLYANLTTPEVVDVIAADPVPNRHAVVHGLVSYNTVRQSVNALIIGEYLLHGISVIVARECEEVPSVPDVDKASDNVT